MVFVGKVFGESAFVRQREVFEFAANPGLVSALGAPGRLVEIIVFDPEEFLIARPQRQTKRIDDSGLAGVIFAHQGRKAWHEGENKRVLSLAKGPEIFYA